jgi:hypothetical protein
MPSQARTPDASTLPASRPLSILTGGIGVLTWAADDVTITAHVASAQIVWCLTGPCSFRRVSSWIGGLSAGLTPGRW